ncbi:HAD family phosphatase [Actinoplanes sp. NPDC026619]|uniref:HAD family hydrolase n=1 Tax=Actinoplanes sp. NPDC026619 TaxID=3155798 RepID=UPI0033E71BCD
MDRISLARTIRISGIRAAIFDMDGTIVDNTHYHERAWREFLRRHGVQLSESNLQDLLSGRRTDQVIPLILGDRMNRTQLAACADEKESIYREMHAGRVREVKGLRGVLDQLKQRGLMLGIATASPQKNRELVLRELGVEDVFDVVLGEEHGKAKPDPEIFLKTAEKLVVAPRACLVFEDSPVGVEAARRAGMKVVGLSTSHSKTELAGADIVVANFTQLTLT